MPNLWQRLFNRKPEAPAAEPTNDEMASDMARYDALLELGYFDDENHLSTEQREAISEALDEKFEELRDQPENAGRSGEDLYVQAGKSITERRDTVRQQDWPGLSLRHSKAIAEAERILGFASLTEEQRDRFSGLLDDRREFLIGQGVDQVKAWTVAAQEIKRVWPELRDAPEIEQATKGMVMADYAKKTGANVTTLSELVHDDDIAGPLGLYRYNGDGFHHGATWYDDTTEARAMLRKDIEEHQRSGREVRVTNGGDNLVYHAIAGKVAYPENPEAFWRKAKERTQTQTQSHSRTR